MHRKCLCTTLFMVALLSGLSHAVDWPGFLGAQRDGHSSERGLILRWPAAGPPLLWQTSMGEGYAMASISAGRVFVFDRADGKERLRALSENDGRLLWEESYAVVYEDAFGFSDGPRANPLVDGDRVYTFGVTGRLRSHSVKDGGIRFDIDTHARYGVIPNFFGVGSNPIVHENRLIAMVGGSPADSPTLDSGQVKAAGSALVAFDKQTGKEQYRLGDDLASYSSPVVVGRDESARGFALARGGLIYFDPKNGRQRAYVPWRSKKLYSVNAATPVVIDDRVFITESYGPGGQLMRVEGDRLLPVWKDAPRDQSIAAHWATPVYHDGHLYGSHGENRGSAELRAVRLSDGEVAWSQPGLGRSTAILVDGHLIVLSEEGRLLVVPASPKGFSTVSDFTPTDSSGERLLSHPAWNAPALANGKLWVRGKTRLLCYDLRLPSKSEAP